MENTWKMREQAECPGKWFKLPKTSQYSGIRSIVGSITKMSIFLSELSIVSDLFFVYLSYL